MFAHLEEQLIALIDVLPLEVFVFVASFVEEVLAPIPSPTVMVLSGSFASLQEYALTGLLVLAGIGALGKTLGAVLVYQIAHVLEEVVVVRFGKFFGVTREDIARFGERLTGSPKDYLLLTVLRSLPFIPSSVVSVGSGVLKVPMRMYIVTTFLGTIVRDGIYLYVGFVGTEALATYISVADRTESLITAGVILTTLCVAGWLYWKRHHRLRP